MPLRPLFLLTDFGLDGYYAGVMKGVVLRNQPQATVVDLSHGVHPGSISEGAYLIEASFEHLPEDAVLLAVVDPGVGSTRRILVVEDGARRLLLPDNGLATPIASRPSASVRAIDWEAVIEGAVCPTFHGRDVFAPLAARLLEASPESLPGEVVDDWVRWTGGPQRDGAEVIGRVVLTDRFGNLITDCRAADLEGFDHLEVGGHRVARLGKTFADVAPGRFLVYVGSGGRVEVALRDGDAAAQLAVGPGDRVLLRRVVTPHDR